MRAVAHSGPAIGIGAFAGLKRLRPRPVTWRVRAQGLLTKKSRIATRSLIGNEHLGFAASAVVRSSREGNNNAIKPIQMLMIIASQEPVKSRS